jgi:hypothetical protein
MTLRHIKDVPDFDRPREGFVDAISDRAASVILAHNQPSGVLKPSTDDIATTRQLVDAGKILGIPVLDHIIITKKSHLSLKEGGFIRLRRRPRACPWMNAQMQIKLRRDVALELRRITAA